MIHSLHNLKPPLSHLELGSFSEMNLWQKRPDAIEKKVN